jgi:hypothetical protein
LGLFAFALALSPWLESSYVPGTSCPGLSNQKQHGKHVFNGLAHFIKGGVIFWFGTLTLGRWMGCFSAQGWAWNLQPFGRKNTKSMEFLECYIIFLYGITNIFLEHLSAWGEAWIPSDFEHVAISLLFIGGGLVSENFFMALDPSDPNTVWLHGRIESISQVWRTQRSGFPCSQWRLFEAYKCSTPHPH